jgi:hypothetical protein
MDIRTIASRASSRQLWSRPAVVGLLLGLGFGLWNLVWTGLYPLAEDTVGALLAFYGPMFAAWAATSFFTSRRTGGLAEGIKAGVVVAFVTFCVLDLLVIVRANLFLQELSGRSDWRALMANFPASGFEGLRSYINYHYVSQAPLKIMVASLIGLGMGVVGGGLGCLTRRASHASAA